MCVRVLLRTKDKHWTLLPGEEKCVGTGADADITEKAKDEGMSLQEVFILAVMNSLSSGGTSLTCQMFAFHLFVDCVIRKCI